MTLPSQSTGAIASETVETVDPQSPGTIRHQAHRLEGTTARPRLEKPPFRRLNRLFDLLKPLWLLSLGLHVGFLAIPLQSHEPSTPKPTPSVKVTKLASSKPKSPKPIRKPKPLSKSVPKAALKPSALALRPRPAPLPKPVQSPQSAKPVPRNEPKPPPLQDASLESEMQDEDGLSDFPQYPGAQPGCFGLSSCLQTGASLAQVSDYFAKTLPAHKWQSELTVDAANRKVYRVSKGLQMQFLSLMEAQKLGTVYVLAGEARTLAELGQAIEVPPEIVNILSGVGAADADASQTAQPDLFSDKANLISLSLLANTLPEEAYDTYFSTNLINSGFESARSPQDYGGGPVYILKRENFTGYLNLVPSREGKGTAIAIWKSPPA